jgi:hypothetical protein
MDTVPGVLYVTPAYSIENFYVGSDTFATIVQDVFGISRSVVNDNGATSKNPEFESLTQAYGAFLSEISSKVLVPLNAYVKAAVHKFVDGADSRLRLNDFSMASLVTVELDVVSVAGDPLGVKELETALRTEGLITKEEFEAQLAGFPLDGVLSNGRGKFALEVVGRVLKQLWDDSAKNKPKYFSKKRLPAAAYSRETILADLSGFAYTPPCLKEFLTKTFN